MNAEGNERWPLVLLLVMIVAGWALGLWELSKTPWPPEPEEYRPQTPVNPF